MNQLTCLVATTPEAQQQGLQQLGVSETETALLLSLLDLGLNPASVKANLLSILALPTDLKQAIREQGLKGAHALALASLSAKTLKIAERQATKERLAATQKVIEQDLTVAKTRELVAQIKAKYLNPKPAESREIMVAAKGLEKLSPEVMKATNQEQLVELQQMLQQKLAEIEAILAE
jgi:ParB family chromosome partitioning protein